MSKIQAVIFDWAGTTVDYGCFAPVQGFLDAYQSIGIQITSEMARAPMGLLKLDHIRAIAAMLREPISEEQIQKAYAVFEETLFANIEEYCELKEDVLETVKTLREQVIKIGSTTGYTSAMMEKVFPRAAQQGYTPDFSTTPDQCHKGRPYPYMIWQNLMHFGLSSPRLAVKVGDTTADIAEGKSANCWTVGVIMGSSLLGLRREEVATLSDYELAERKEKVRAAYYQAGADYIIDDLRELPNVIAQINQRLAQNTDHKLLTPGPLSTKAAVKEAMLTDHCTWDEEYKAITTSVMNDITRISANEDYETVLLQGSGSYAVEAMLHSLCDEKETTLFLVNGEYGKRMLTMAQAARRDYEVLSFSMTEPIDLQIVEKKLKENPHIAALAFVHCETTTGVLNPLSDLAKLGKAYGKKVLVDAMSSFGAYEIDMPGLDVDALAASGNKCLEAVPGLSFVITKKSLLEKSQGRAQSHSLDLYEQYRELCEHGGKFRFTSPTHVLLALREALDEYQKEGGQPARKKRYQENHRVLTEGLSALGFRPIVDALHQSYIITTYELGGLDFGALYRSLKSKGYIIYPGKLTSKPTFRLGNIGDLYPSDMVGLVRAIASILEEK
jgi:2-aminoethylphosphonate--pyruvate transaminase/phosphonoacetaldehyde hydrolase